MERVDDGSIGTGPLPVPGDDTRFEESWTEEETTSLEPFLPMRELMRLPEAG